MAGAPTTDKDMTRDDSYESKWPFADAVIADEAMPLHIPTFQEFQDQHERVLKEIEFKVRHTLARAYASRKLMLDGRYDQLVTIIVTAISACPCECETLNRRSPAPGVPASRGLPCAPCANCSAAGAHVRYPARSSRKRPRAAEKWERSRSK